MQEKTTLKVPFMDLRITNIKEREKLNETFIRLMNHGQYIMGREVENFEKKIASYCDRKYCVGVASGTDALYIALKSMGIGEGDEVITTSLSWIATANAIAMTGAKPIFADINDNLNINTQAIESLISDKTKAIMPVHYTGRVADLDGLQHLASKYNIKLVCDSAQAFGSIWKNKPVGAFGDVACFSMNPMKTLSACGEAGAIVTNDIELYEKMQILRYNGTINKEVCVEPSLNGRLDSLQAAILVDRLDFLDEKIRRRREIAAYYDELLKGIVSIPEQDTKDNISAYYSYTIKTKDRNGLATYLLENGVETKVQHPILMSEQLPYKNNKKNTSKKAQEIVDSILCLPASESVDMEDVEYISNLINKYFS